MMLLNDLFFLLAKEYAYADNLPINVLIGDKYYDIEDFFFDKEIHEHILKIGGGIDYKSRADILVPFKIKIKDDKMIERFMVDDAGSLIDKDTGKSYNYFEEMLNLLNEINHERVENRRKLNTLKHTIKRVVEV